jgi:solute carrier family 25 thiamine pyrophosphate transporter 19
MPPLEEQEEMGMIPLPLEFGARRWDVDLGPGEVLFVPGGSPHAVRNLDCTVAFAGNFVDDVNLDRVLEDLKLMAAKDPALMDSFRALDEVDFDDEGAALAAHDDDDDDDAGAFDANARVVRVADYLAGGRLA